MNWHCTDLFAYGHEVGHTIGMHHASTDHDNDTVIEPGMIFMIHPNQYLPETGYLLCGEPVVLTPQGAQPLTEQKASLATVGNYLRLRREPPET
jgi:Xaa-Pro aminopeptidase